ncbi:hypothetical protein Y032_0387g483 [Ancylostoma ceylanicum]|uniref:Uncharacterized protein n=1 Tax=Ancylostoma ceylanicum TaxID=53326 RepID=A0A016RSM6_9BILA|nr:hypothetical protein Y032_0387g483 [Ancylostoma ceylanicum]
MNLANKASLEIFLNHSWLLALRAALYLCLVSICHMELCGDPTFSCFNAKRLSSSLFLVRISSNIIITKKEVLQSFITSRSPNGHQMKSLAHLQNGIICIKALTCPTSPTATSIANMQWLFVLLLVNLSSIETSLYQVELKVLGQCGAGASQKP